MELSQNELQRVKVIENAMEGRISMGGQLNARVRVRALWGCNHRRGEGMT